MAEPDSKPKIPAYISHKPFTKFINDLELVGLPNQIDKSMMQKMSGSGQSALLGSLEFLRLIDSKGIPTESFHQLIDAKGDSRKAILRSVIEGAYPFLFGGGLDLKRATTKQVEEAFRDQGISGSTVVKCIAFFLAAAKEAGIAVSPLVKTPTLARPAGRRTASSGAQDARSDDPADDDDGDVEDETTVRLKLPLLGKRDVVLLLPADFNDEDWTFLKPIFESYMDQLLKRQLLK
jgi:hypothetical protein